VDREHEGEGMRDRSVVMMIVVAITTTAARTMLAATIRQ